MRVYARIALLLGAYLLVGGLVYGGTGKERIGLVLLLVAGGGFAYLGLYARRAVRAADRASSQAEAEPGGSSGVEPGGPALTGETETEEVRPTIWPLVFSLAGAGIVVGVLASHWILLAGGLLAIAAAAGWFREVLSQGHERG